LSERDAKGSDVLVVLVLAVLEELRIELRVALRMDAGIRGCPRSAYCRGSGPS